MVFPDDLRTGCISLDDIKRMNKLRKDDPHLSPSKRLANTRPQAVSERLNALSVVVEEWRARIRLSIFEPALRMPYIWLVEMLFGEIESERVNGHVRLG